MSVEVWPPIAPEQLKVAVETSQKRELDWLIEELHETLTNLKHGLADCYALLAPIDPGSTLVLSTPRNEIVKGTVTRVGTRIVKGTIHLRLRTLPHQTLTINPDHPIHLSALTSLHTLLTHSIDLLDLTLSYSYPTPSSSPTAKHQQQKPGQESSSPQFLAAQLRLLAQSLAEASSLLKGPPLTTADPSWTTRSVAPSHFASPPTSSHHHTPQQNNDQNNAVPPPLSFHLSIQDSCLVLWLRSLEPADAPVNFGTKLALAIGTTRRLEHDESDKIFGFCCTDDDHPHNGPVLSGSKKPKNNNTEIDVYVREKVRVETADPSLLSLSAKLIALSHTLELARKNLAAVMGSDATSDDGEKEDDAED
ncbi:RAVE subunit 2/Rogdi [Apodospora peruviana]|uniref:RAVE subunit 2/Rogdi n=1 Tax=Apodospora peruviana TaxID=516989 RepID=A0AAE0MGZ0_9PEZI|nr:RAVE subunit 2/Rogdi [Apodospora peruviana]